MFAILFSKSLSDVEHASASSSESAVISWIIERMEVEQSRLENQDYDIENESNRSSGDNVQDQEHGERQQGQQDTSPRVGQDEDESNGESKRRKKSELQRLRRDEQPESLRILQNDANRLRMQQVRGVETLIVV